ncbi:MAG TPA: RHS repeat-associated core domain-containing protein, partial [Tepidiformaceae bacterium]
DYNVFGQLRAGAGTGTFGFTGEQYDAETGYTYLRACYYDPALGRFASADSVQPNAPGTQGYNLYAHVANNSTTWTDPSGNTSRPVTCPGGRRRGGVRAWPAPCGRRG